MVNKKRLKKQEIRRRQDDTANKAMANIHYTEQKIADRGYRVMNNLKNNGNKPLKLTIRFEASGNEFYYPKNKEK